VPGWAPHVPATEYGTVRAPIEHRDSNTQFIGVISRRIASYPRPARSGDAARAEIGAFAVRVLDRLREVHDALGIGAMVESGDVAEFVYGLDQETSVEGVVDVGATVEGPSKPGQSDDGTAPADGGLAEDECQSGDVKVGIDDT